MILIEYHHFKSKMQFVYLDMAQTTEPLNEGVKYELTFTIDSITATRLDGETATLYAYLNGTEKVLGTATISSTSVVFSATDTDELLPGKRYDIEVWTNKGAETRELIHPSETDELRFYIVDREGVEIE